MAKRGRRGSGQTMIQRSRRVAPSSKAVFHNASGAGRSRVKREFFNLSEKEGDAIFALLEKSLDKNVKRSS